ncbi:uncharacterized protein LOC114537560 isoform X2 [Dendronephthya gigantea]|uniref:uncharacterized protein LOC114537560 isoform X2 n=1 Tax=Dendronephthya gigantea TaxID=151771 RepID=UPI00106D1D1E|nr:uncharacterized protein LOC114537560 isoform X2 [Dendronephthya gigantea]
MSARRQKLYFFDQDQPTHVRRKRKPVDQLPFSLPFTGVSGTLKVEAYLRQQIKISEAAGDSSPQTPDQITNNNEDIDDQKQTKDGFLQQDGDQSVAKATRKGKSLATFSEYNEPDEDEDTQRFLFEENKFAAPNLLAHLGRILEILYETRVDRNNNISARVKTLDNWANLTTSNNRYLNLSTSHFNLRAIGISIPFHLAEKLKWNFEQLIVNTVYSKRQWQTIGYKQQANITRSVTGEFDTSQQQGMSELHEVTETKSGEDIANNEFSGKHNRNKRDSLTSKKSKKITDDSKTLPETSQDSQKRGSVSFVSKKSRKSTTDEQVQKPSIHVETVTDDKRDSISDSIGQSPNSNEDQLLLKPTQTVSTNTVKRDSISSMKDEDQLKDGELLKSVQGFRRESLKCINAVKAPRTRLEKYKYIPDKSHLALSWRKKVDKEAPNSKEKDGKEKKMTDETGTEKDLIGQELENEYISYHRMNKEEGPMSGHSIFFSLMSKTCEDNGWVHHVNPDADLERLTVIEWARARLQEAIQKSSEHDLSKHGSELVIKQYGGAKIDVNQQTKIWMKQCEEKSLVCITKFVTFMPDHEDTTFKQPKVKKVAPVVLKEYGEKIVGKVRKGRQKIKRTPSGTAKIDLFIIALPDNTLNLYYPSGKIAVCTARNMVGEGKYTYVYGTDGETLLAYFTPTNAFCCDKSGKIFMCTPKEGTIYNKENTLIEHWTWKTCIKNPVKTFELNEFLTLKIASRNQMNVHFSARQDTYKLNVGITQDLHCILVNSAGEMMTTGDYLSEVAQQLTVLKTNKVPRTRREERRARAQQRKSSQQSNPEDLQAQRKEDLDKIFPERKNLALDLPSDVDLYKMRRRIKGIVYDWMESYRFLAGISVSVKIPDRRTHRKHTMSAKSLPGKMPSTQVTFKRSGSPMITAEHRAPSAPPLPRGEKVNVVPLENFVKSVEGLLEYGNESRDYPGVSSVYLTEMDREKILANQAGLKPPFRCGMMSYENRNSSLKEGCPVALRAELLGEKYPCCRCRKREIPFVSDFAYDKFIKESVPHTQLLVVSIISSRNPSVTQCTSMLEQLYYEKNRNRSFPCAQCCED